MASKVFSGLRNIKRYQRLSVSEIHGYWNKELHRSAGHKRFQVPENDLDKSIAEGNENPFLQLVKTFSNAGKWVDENGDFVEGESIESDLVEFVDRGDLIAYVGMSPNSEKCSLEGLSGKSLFTKSHKYHLDRDELGRFLLANKIDLPMFWYNDKDVGIYKDQLGRDDLALVDLRNQLADLVNENGLIKAQLLDAMPFMNSDHPYYSPELEAAVALWLDSYSDNEEGAIVRKKPALENWLKDNRSEAVSQADGSVSKAALERISMVVNPNKQGGRPSAKV